MQVFRNIKPILALFIMFMGFAYFFVITVLEKQNDQVLIAVVALTSMAGSYYFGSSSGSSKKDEAISNMASKTQIENSDNNLIITKENKDE